MTLFALVRAEDSTESGMEDHAYIGELLAGIIYLIAGVQLSRSWLPQPISMTSSPASGAIEDSERLTRAEFYPPGPTMRG